MKAIRVKNFGGPEVLELETMADPKPGPGQVVVTLKAIGVNPVEAYVRDGTYPAKPALPYTPGTDGAGVIESTGSGVQTVKAGDRVYIYGSLTGTYAERALCTEPQVHPLPEKTSFAQGAAMGVPYGTAYRALFYRAIVKLGETVLIHGASGGVGTAAVQLARAAGLIVLGTAGSEEGRQLVKREGAHDVFDHHAPDYLEHIRHATRGKGVDVILEMLANVNLGKDLTVLAPRGRVIAIGSRGPVEIDARNLMGRDADIRGMTLRNATEAELEQIHAALSAGLDSGTLAPVVGQEIPLAQATRAHQEIMDKGAYGKIVLIP